MQLDRRALLFGSVLGAVAVESRAEACSLISYSPLETSFWKRLWADAVTAPRLERAIAVALVQAIVADSREGLDKLLSPKTMLFSSGSPFEKPASFERHEAIEKLSTYVNRHGTRSFAIRHFGVVQPHFEFLVHASLNGNGASKDPHAVVTSLCGSFATLWNRELVFTFQVDSFTSAMLDERPKIFDIKLLG